MTAVALALLSAALFGTMSPALRLALREVPDVALGAVVSTAAAFCVPALAAAVDAPRAGQVEARQLLVFVGAGLLGPGASQLLFLLAIREAGAARASVVVGAAPLLAVAIALVALHEPARPALLVGAVLVVGGGSLLVGERARPARFRRVGLAFAVGSALCFSTRDVLVRWAAGATRVPPLPAAATSLLAGLALMALVLLARPSTPRPPARLLVRFVPPGLLFGASYASLFEAYGRGRVTVVSPLVATESLWALVAAALLLRGSERIGRRLVGGAALVVAGGALVGAVR